MCRIIPRVGQDVLQAEKRNGDEMHEIGELQRITRRQQNKPKQWRKWTSMAGGRSRKAVRHACVIKKLKAGPQHGSLATARSQTAKTRSGQLFIK
ncbi:hypothetical protein SUGI_0333160 [Cryptomeria japonica]|nr:hypothetical protein SUGI_0333160 [Cryptomeria japonica]